MSSQSLPALAFHSHPEPLAVLEGDTIRAANQAWSGRIGAGESLRACIDAQDHEAIDRAREGALHGRTTVIARLAAGPRADPALQWTLWPAGGEGSICIRLDGPAPPDPRADGARDGAPLDTGGTSAKATALLRMFDSLDATLWTIRRDGTLTLSEGKGLAHYGLAPGQIVGLNAFEIYPPDSYADRTTRRPLAGESLRLELVESDRHWVTFCEPVRAEDGSVESMIGLGILIGENVKDTHHALKMMDIINQLPLAVWAMQSDGACVLSAGKALARLGLSPGQLIGKNILELFGSDPEIRDQLRRGLSGETFTVEVPQGGVFWRTTYVPARDGLGNVCGLYGVSEDITDRKHDEERTREHLAVIERQTRALASLASPIIEVWQGVLVVPIIGSLDAERAAVVTEDLLGSVVRRRARHAILDLTGVDAVDTATAHHLSAITRGVELLGCTSLVSGIRPSVAATMVALGISLPTDGIHPTLADALRRCIQVRRP